MAIIYLFFHLITIDNFGVIQLHPLKQLSQYQTRYRNYKTYLNNIFHVPKLKEAFLYFENKHEF